MKPAAMPHSSLAQIGENITVPVISAKNKA